FNKTTSTDNLPKNEVVQETLLEAMNSTSLNITFVPGSIKIKYSPLTTTAPSTNSSITAITATPTTTTPTTVESSITRRLTFRTTEETFTADLLNLSSTAFRNRTALLKSNLEPLYKNMFPSLCSFTVISFSNGSIVNNINLEFATASAPNKTQIVNVLVQAVSNITVFIIDTDSVVVDVTYNFDKIMSRVSYLLPLSQTAILCILIFTGNL
uniref:SEA domain-containing protein n=1 Tax=Poecilia formosa TaxID=48698 RepID=A0A087Y4G8_POEFO